MFPRGSITDFCCISGFVARFAEYELIKEKDETSQQRGEINTAVANDNTLLKRVGAFDNEKFNMAGHMIRKRLHNGKKERKQQQQHWQLCVERCKVIQARNDFSYGELK